MRALERSADKRFSTCAQFADALEAAATGRERIATPRGSRMLPLAISGFGAGGMPLARLPYGMKLIGPASL